MTYREPFLQPLTWICINWRGCWWFSESEHEEWVFPCSMECVMLCEETVPSWQAFPLSVLSKPFRQIFVGCVTFPPWLISLDKKSHVIIAGNSLIEEYCYMSWSCVSVRVWWWAENDDWRVTVLGLGDQTWLKLYFASSFSSLKWC